MRFQILFAAVCCVLSIVVDALLASKPVEFADAPSSMRLTSLILTILLASPIIVNPKTSFVGIWQRPIFGTLLTLVAMWGKNQGSAETRLFDVYFIACTTAGAIGLFSSAGVDETSAKLVQSMSALITKSSLSITAAMLFFASCRIMRTGLVSPHLAADFRISSNDTTISLRGYSAESDAASLLVVFGAAVGMGTSICAFYHESTFGVCGVKDIHTQLSAAASFIALSGYATLLRVGDALEALQNVFSRDACYGDACDVAYETRRGGLKTVSCGVSLLLLSVAIFSLTRKAKNDIFTNLALLLGVFATLLSITGEGVAAYADATGFIAVCACWLSVSDPFLAGAIGFSAFIAELTLSSEKYGPDVIFSHISNTTLITLSCSGLLAILFSWVACGARSRTAEKTCAFFATVTHSITLAYFLGSCGLIASYAGGLMSFDEPTMPPRREALNFSVKHFLPLAFSSSLYASCVKLSATAHYTGWYSAIALPIFYTLAMAVSNRITPALSPVDLYAFFSFLLLAIPAWVLASIF